MQRSRLYNFTCSCQTLAAPNRDCCAGPKILRVREATANVHSNFQADFERLKEPDARSPMTRTAIIWATHGCCIVVLTCIPNESNFGPGQTAAAQVLGRLRYLDLTNMAWTM